MLHRELRVVVFVNIEPDGLAMKGTRQISPCLLTGTESESPRKREIEAVRVPFEQPLPKRCP